MKGTWDTGHEQNFLDHAHLLGWDSGLVQDLVGHYTRVAQGTLGEITPALIEDFHHTFAARLLQEERDRLVQWNVDRSPRWPAVRSGPPPPLVPFRGNRVVVIDNDVETAQKMLKKLAGPDLMTVQRRHVYYMKPGAMRVMKSRLARKKLAKSRRRAVAADLRAEAQGR